MLYQKHMHESCTVGYVVSPRALEPELWGPFNTRHGRVASRIAPSLYTSHIPRPGNTFATSTAFAPQHLIMKHLPNEIILCIIACRSGTPSRYLHPTYRYPRS
jgi:hypothetical protein